LSTQQKTVGMDFLSKWNVLWVLSHSEIRRRIKTLEKLQINNIKTRFL
jgi:hypothetical protein